MSGRAGPRPVQAAVRLYRWAACLYPRAFRRAFGPELVGAFRDLAADAWRRGRWAGLLGLVPASLLDLCRGAVAERWAVLRHAATGAAPSSPVRTSPSQRRRAALRLRSESPRSRSEAMENLLHDLRFAVRQLRRTPAFTGAVIATIALGVGAVSAIYTVVDGVLLSPLPFPDSDRAVVFCELHESVGDYCIASPPNVEDWGRLSESLAEVGVARTWGYTLRDEDGQTNVTAAIATPGYLRVHGARAEIGRLLQESDLPEGDNRVVVLTYGLWQSRFAGDPGIVGRSLTMDEEPYTVIGVLAPDTWIHDFGWVQAWVPLTATPEETDTRGWRGFSAVGLLSEGSDLSRARRELEGIRAALEDEYPEDNRGWGLQVRSMRDDVAGPVRSTLLIFLLAVGCVLLIGCANVANLLLVRATQRASEFAVRASLGAGRRRLVRQVLTESVMLAGIGGALGLVLAVLATDGFLALAPTSIPRLEEVGVDLRVLGFTGLLSLITAVLFGLVPALRAARTDLNDSLRSGRQGGSGSSRLRNGLVVAQTALALVLLVIAGLLGRSFVGLLTWDPGFDPRGLVTASVYANFGRYENGRQVVADFERLADAVRAMPGVQAVGMTSAGPLFGGRETSTMLIEGGPPLPPEQRPTVRWYDVDPEYFATMGIPMVRGRSFRPTDDAGSVPAAIVNETFVARNFPDRSPIGERVTVDERSMEIVGVVADVRPFRPDEAPAAEIYYPKRQYPRGGTYLVIRSGVPPASLARQMRDVVERDLPGLSVSRVATLEEHADRQLVSPRFSLALMGLFGLVALTLAAVGIYGVMAYGVATRVHEIGVRMALGARPRGIMLSVLSSAVGLALVGLAIGVAMALAAGGLIASQLHGVSGRDLPTYAVVGIVTLAVAALAGVVPARRASRLDPVRALRTE